MITRFVSLRLLVMATILSSVSISAQTAWSQSSARQSRASEATRMSQVDDRIDISHARPVQQAQDQSTMQGGLQQSAVQQATFSGGFGGLTGGGSCDNCGPVCDCAGGAFDASCGVESFEPSCGCDMNIGCSCGLEIMGPSCGCEAGGCSCGVGSIGMDCGCAMGACGCGAEVSCGIESLGSVCGCPIGNCSCGVEAVLGPACGMEAACGCDACSGIGSCDSGSCGISSCDGGGSCDSACGSGRCLPGFEVFLPYMKIDWCRIDLFAGVNSFSGPMNCANIDPQNPDELIATGGSFGFYEGFNEGRNLKRLLGFDIAGQLGVRATQSHLSGTKITNEERHQIFVTAGFFRRVDYGLQYGLVVDYLNTDWYFQGDVLQVRSEVSWNNNNCSVFGVQIMQGTNDEESSTFVQDLSGTTVQSSVMFEAVDQTRVFYRRLLAGSGTWEAFLGGTSQKDTVLGCLVNAPMSETTVFNAGVTYIDPNSDEGNSLTQEAWNLSMGFTFRPGGSRGCGRYCRPMFQVADNGTLAIRRK